MAKGWHKEDIKAAVRKRGVTLQALDAENKLPPGTCSFALVRPNFAAEWVIAEFLGRSPRELWPQRYDAAGTYKHLKSQQHHTRRRADGECQNGVRA